MAIIWCMVPEIWSYEVQQTEFLVLLDHFLPFYPVIIILNMCNINHNHMIHSSWDMKRDRQNFLSFWTVFLPFHPPDNPKNQNFEKMKNNLEILSFYTCVTQMKIIRCMVPEMWSMADIIFCHFGLFFAILPP